MPNSQLQCNIRYKSELSEKFIAEDKGTGDLLRREARHRGQLNGHGAIRLSRLDVIG